MTSRSRRTYLTGTSSPTRRTSAGSRTRRSSRSGSSGKLYLAAVLNLYSRFVVGWAVNAINDRHLVIKALRMALKRRRPPIGLLHHSDRGSLYASEDYRAILAAHGMMWSMSRRGCHDNAVMESWFSTVKLELGERFDSCGQAKMELFDYIEVFYNRRRRHSTRPDQSGRVRTPDADVSSIVKPSTRSDQAHEARRDRTAPSTRGPAAAPSAAAPPESGPGAGGTVP